jgi:hypothetical protein
MVLSMALGSLPLNRWLLPEGFEEGVRSRASR